MKRFFLFAIICILCFSVQAQSSGPVDNFVFGSLVPDYLQKVITTGKVTVNGVQILTREPEIVLFQKRQLRNYGPSMRLHPETVIYLGEHIVGRPDLDNNFWCYPNPVPVLSGIRGGNESMGGPTAEQAVLMNAAAK